MSKIETVEQLRKVYKPALGRSLEKELTYLDPHCKKFITLAPFVAVDRARHHLASRTTD